MKCTPVLTYTFYVHGYIHIMYPNLAMPFPPHFLITISPLETYTYKMRDSLAQRLLFVVCWIKQKQTIKNKEIVKCVQSNRDPAARVLFK